MNTWLTVLLAVLGLLGAGGGLASLLTVRASRRQIVAQADETVAGAARVLIGGAADLVEPLRRQLDAAEARTGQIIGELQAVNGQLQIAQRRADHLEGQLERLRGWIHDPYMTIEVLRARVSQAGVNGAPSTQEGR